MTGGATPPMPGWLQELPVLNTENPETGYYVALGEFEGVLNPVFYIGSIWGDKGLAFAGPTVEHVWTVNSKWRFESVYTNKLVLSTASQKILDDYNIQGGYTAKTRLQLSELNDASQLHGKLLLDE